jgi:hypothetical protein
VDITCDNPGIALDVTNIKSRSEMIATRLRVPGSGYGMLPGCMEMTLLFGGHYYELMQITAKAIPDR